MSEYITRPHAVIVHDPVRAGSFEAMESIEDPAALEQRFLYRQLPDKTLYGRQHLELVTQLRQHLVQVLYLEDLVFGKESHRFIRNNPNQVFTRDSIITLPWLPQGYIRARMRRTLRRNEPYTMETALQTLGLRELFALPEGLFLEGGDVVPFCREEHRTLLVGCGRRTGFDTLEFLHQACIPEFADEIIGIELAGWRMNLDGGLMPVAEDVVIADRDSVLKAHLFDVHGHHEIDLWALFRDLGMHIIETTPSESVYSQSCNCVCMGERKVIYYDLCPRVEQLLHRHDVTTYLVPGSELVKGRGGPRCMTRPIYD